MTEQREDMRWLQRRVITGSHRTVYLVRLALTPVTPWGQLYLHVFHRPDEDQEPHDHPWDFWTLPLSGGYVEEVLDKGDGSVRQRLVPWLRPARRPGEHAHRVLRWTGWRRRLVTLVWRGPATRGWGFWMRDDDYGLMLTRLGHGVRTLGTCWRRTCVHWRPYLTYRAEFPRN